MSYAGEHLSRILDAWREGMRQYCIDSGADTDAVLTPGFVLQRALQESMVYAIQLDAEGNADAVRDVIAWARAHLLHLHDPAQSPESDKLLRYVTAAAHAQAEADVDGRDGDEGDA